MEKNFTPTFIESREVDSHISGIDVETGGLGSNVIMVHTGKPERTSFDEKLFKEARTFESDKMMLTPKPTNYSYVSRRKRRKNNRKKKN